VVTLAILTDPAIKAWLGGVEPAWTMLDQASVVALAQPPSSESGPIRLSTNLAPEEFHQSVTMRNALAVLRAAAIEPGLKMTALGNLSRGVVAQMRDLISWPGHTADWPGHDNADAFEFHKVINEADFSPLFFVRHLVQTARLLRRYKGHLTITPSGRRLLDEAHASVLQAVLFHGTFWNLDLDYFSVGILDGWPQCDTGIVMWSLSVAAHDWQPVEHLTRLCTVPVGRLLDRDWDTGSFAMDAQILRPLSWFGLLERRTEEPAPGKHERRIFYRKTALFDRFLSFDVRLESAGTQRH